MFVLYGVYNFARKRIGYRNDYCLSCEGQKISEQWQSFDALHLFYLPLVPLGIKKRWLCATCGNNPHMRVKSSKTFLVGGAILCLLMAFVMWTAPVGTGEDAKGAWVMRILLPLAFIGLLVPIFKQTPAPNLSEQLKSVPPLTEDNCPYCNGRMLPGPIPQCGSCGVQRHRVN